MRNRGFYPESMERHLMAVFRTGDRTEEVQTIDKPTLVIHGSEDPLIPPSTACIPRNKFKVLSSYWLKGWDTTSPSLFIRRSSD